MGRPPCCDKVGIKKGPWTPEEDILLVSYIQEHGPGNWRSVPTNTGLMRCSKSCRLRWTNYLRPGIKRGNFTPHEEGMIIHLQALLGNKWAAIASYLPQRTDNDIKNYWNTHLKKKLKKLQSAFDPHKVSDSTSSQFFPKGFNDRRCLDSISPSSSFGPNPSSTYYSSTENISRLLEGWMRSSPKSHDNQGHGHPTAAGSAAAMVSVQCSEAKADIESDGLASSGKEFESIASYGDLNNNVASWDKSVTCESNLSKKSSQSCVNEERVYSDQVERNKQRSENNPPLSFLEKWLLDESALQVEEMMELSPMF